MTKWGEWLWLSKTTRLKFLVLDTSTTNYTVFKKTCDYVFGNNLNQNCPFGAIFGTLITESTGHRQVFLFSHLTYFMHLLYLGNCGDLSTGGPRAQSGGQAKKAPISSWDFAWNCHNRHIVSCTLFSHQLWTLCENTDKSNCCMQNSHAIKYKQIC